MTDTALKLLPFLCLAGLTYGYVSVADIRSTVETLFKRVESLQNKDDTPYTPPLFWQKNKGLWESDVKFYFHGHEDLFLLREVFAVYDNNMFATTWITSCLLEAYRYGNAPKPDDEGTILNAVLALREYHNKNLDYANSLMTFWPQVYNTSTQFWNSFPVNIHHLFDESDNMNATTLEKILKELGFSDIAQIIDQLTKTKSSYLTAFEIPPDFDDTFVNVGLGSLLSEVKDAFPVSHAQWRSQNTNLTSVFDALRKYAYRPMSSDENVNTIDCRTYFFLRHFLEDAQNKSKDVALIPTWIQNFDELKEMYWKGVAMPLNVNNVDVTVAANSVFGMTSAVLNDLVDTTVLDDPVIQQVYLNTSSYIGAMIRGNFSSRPDLALLYYPSALEFYWFVARTYGELERKSRLGPLPHHTMNTVRGEFDEILHLYMTPAVLNKTQTDADGTVYFDDFLGNGDVDRHGNTVIRGQDRLFTTGMAINALLSTWTVFDEKTKQLVWEKDTLPEVKDTVSRAAAFLNKHIMGIKYQPWNAFFSGSVKGNETWPQYPLNQLNFTTPKGQLMRFGMEGVISEQDYELMLADWRSHGWAPQDFHGFNSQSDFWPFWSSEPYTYVTCMLAMAKFTNTVDFLARGDMNAVDAVGVETVVNISGRR